MASSIVDAYGAPVPRSDREPPIANRAFSNSACRSRTQYVYLAVAMASALQLVVLHFPGRAHAESVCHLWKYAFVDAYACGIDMRVVVATSWRG